ncbi:Hypothetical protein CINCED_3A008873 [Cinara cedri]|uniref:Uncharacterized protein n=1 Tax=Cinara cedri TaxID=506608 RepID=A0A5E4NLV4_9HEMI|nr:Hypothetical protein CINCED_3A008873 [Cinara cedri]
MTAGAVSGPNANPPPPPVAPGLPKTRKCDGEGNDEGRSIAVAAGDAGVSGVGRYRQFRQRTTPPFNPTGTTDVSTRTFRPAVPRAAAGANNRPENRRIHPVCLFNNITSVRFHHNHPGERLAIHSIRMSIENTS